MMQLGLSHIDKAYNGKAVLQDVSLLIRSGEAVVLTGPSGIGKTTLLRILTGREKPDQGLIQIDRETQGKQISHREKAEQRIHFGVDFQEDRLLENESALENIRLVMKRTGGKADCGAEQFRKKETSTSAAASQAAARGEMPGWTRREEERAWARRELSLLLPEDELDKPVRELSGGMRRRVCLVRAMILPKDIYVLDEPFTGLDAAARSRCIQYVQDKITVTKNGYPAAADAAEYPDMPAVILSAHDLDGLEWMREFRL